MSTGVGTSRYERLVSWIDVGLLLGVIVLVYALVGVASQWTGPFQSSVQIDLSLSALPGYAFLSLVRGFVAYAFSLAFTILFGYWAAHSRAAEQVLIPTFDILQSIPVMGFLPGLVLALVTLFPDSNIGIELACIFMIFTGQAWNMVFSFYSSLKGVPQSLRDVGRIYSLRRLQVLAKLELPFSMNGLLWNSMLSMAGGWFFLMVVESFTLGDQSFRLPGIGSYMAVAIDSGDSVAIWSGIGAMMVVIIVVDRLLWAPLVVWSGRYQTDRKIEASVDSLVVTWLRKSQWIRNFERLKETVVRFFESTSKATNQVSVTVAKASQLANFFLHVFQAFLAVVLLGGLVYGGKQLYELVFALSVADWLLFFRNTLITFVRVAVAVVLGSLWTIPVGVFIGTNARWTQRLQPVVQMIAAFPAPMIFPLVTLLLLNLGVSFEFGAVVLMLIGSQWYILFNVISGATRVPNKFRDVANIFHVRGWRYWKVVILPAIFPSLVNGWITAAGGAWNASIVSEFVQYGDRTYSATGIGSTIFTAAEAADFARLAGAIVVMIVAIVLLNRIFWGKMYKLAETKYRLEA